MRTFATLVRKDLKGYFDQPTGFMLLVIFVSVAAYMFFRTALISQEASMRPLFTLLPWVLAVFVPAATMRLVAEEQRDGTLEILLTQPLRTWTVLLSKFLAGLIFVGAGVLATAVIPISLQTAGDFDNGAVIAQYLGTAFLTASFVAIGLFTSSLTRNQIIAFVIGLSIIVALMVAGMPIITLAIPPAAAVLVQDLSPLTHFEGIARGVLDLRDVVYFVGLVSTFLSATYLMIRGKSVSHKSSLYRNLQLGVGGLVVLSILIGWSGSSIGGRLDLTENKLFTLDDATVELLQELDDIVTIRLFVSEDPPVQVALTQRDVEDLLEDIVNVSNGNVRLVRYLADKDEESAELAMQSFVPPINFSEQTGGEFKVKVGYLGMGMTYANRQENVPFVETTDGLEYRLMANIRRMAQKRPSTISFMHGHGEWMRDADLQSFRDQLERHHLVLELDADREDGLIQGSAEPFAGTDVLVVPGSREEVPPWVRASIDEFLAEGGKVLMLVDSLEVDDRALRATKANTGLTGWLGEYGVLVQDNVVFDTRSHETLLFNTRFGGVNLAYPYWPRVKTEEQAISGGVNSVVFPWTSSIEIGEATGETIETEIKPLVVTSEFAAIDASFRDLTPRSPTLEEYTEEDLGEHILAVAVTGTRCSYYKPECEKNPENSFRMVVAADSMWLTERMVNGFPEHVVLAVNWIDWLSQEDQLAAIRSKGRVIRQLVFTSDLHRDIVQYGNIFGVSAALIVFAMVRFFLRRRTTRKAYTVER